MTILTGLVLMAARSDDAQWALDAVRVSAWWWWFHALCGGTSAGGGLGGGAPRNRAWALHQCNFRLRKAHVVGWCGLDSQRRESDFQGWLVWSVLIDGVVSLDCEASWARLGVPLGVSP